MTTFIFEGPNHERLSGWRHYQIRFGDGRVMACAHHPGRVPALVKLMRAEFFAAGTWESDEPTWLCRLCSKKWAVPGLHPDCHGEASDMGRSFPLPRPELLEKLCGGTALQNRAGQADA